MGSTISFNGVDAGTAVDWTNNRIVVAVPADATLGPVVVTVGANASNSDNLFTLTPSITEVSPLNGLVGDAITISGAYFGASQAQGASTVGFNGTDAGAATSWSQTQIIFTYRPGLGPAT